MTWFTDHPAFVLATEAVSAFGLMWLAWQAARSPTRQREPGRHPSSAWTRVPLRPYDWERDDR